MFCSLVSVKYFAVFQDAPYDKWYQEGTGRNENFMRLFSGSERVISISINVQCSEGILCWTVNNESGIGLNFLMIAVRFSFIDGTPLR